MITATNEDNMIMMARYPDDYFDLAIIDPPYGININANMGLKKGQKKKHSKVEWDNEIPNDDYWNEVFRVSANQIVWGANYFPQVWKGGCKHFIFWDKETPLGMSFSDGELAYTSFDRASRKFTFRNTTGSKIHPTQKPVKLYEWLLMNYAKEGDKILDTHRGSASLDIACHNLGFDLVTCEIDTDYFNDGNKRLKQHQNQQVMKF